MNDLTIIVAASLNNVIGVEGKLPWHISEDLKRFKQITMGNSIIMGRKTYDSIKKPLVGRENIVITRNKDYNEEGITVYHSIEEVLKNVNKGFIIGGQQIYEQTISLANKIEMTRVLRNIDGDAYFPQITDDEWNLVMKDKRTDYEFLTYERRY